MLVIYTMPVWLRCAGTVSHVVLAVAGVALLAPTVAGIVALR
jgi:hypothetical protein